MSGRRQGETKAQWVRDNLPAEFHGAYGEVLALMLNAADLQKLRDAIEAYGARRAKDAIDAYGDPRAQEVNAADLQQLRDAIRAKEGATPKPATSAAADNNEYDEALKTAWNVGKREPSREGGDQ